MVNMQMTYLAIRNMMQHVTNGARLGESLQSQNLKNCCRIATLK